MEVIRKYTTESLLDVGCGNGSYVKDQSERILSVGVDLSFYPAWNTMTDSFLQASATDLPFRSKAFEVVSCFEVLEHVHSPDRVIRELRRVAQKYVVVSTPNCWLPSALEESRLAYFHYTDASHVNFWTLAELVELMQDQGLEVVEKREINKVNLSPLFSDQLIGPRRLWRAILDRFGTDYFMTNLLVGRVKD